MSAAFCAVTVPVVDSLPTSRQAARKLLRFGLSLFVLFHLTCMVLTPVSDGYLGGVFMGVVRPYVQFLELTNHWNFFSPNPEPAVFIDYQLAGGDGEAFQSGRWPEEGEAFFWKERQMRRVTAADYMVNFEVAAEKMMVNYLCHKVSKPASIRLWRVMEPVPRSQDVQSGKRKLGDRIGAERRFVSHTYCSSLEGM